VTDRIGRKRPVVPQLHERADLVIDFSMLFAAVPAGPSGRAVRGMARLRFFVTSSVAGLRRFDARMPLPPDASAATG
jgi:hypothetical protein